MADISGTYQRASVLEAARILGVSPTTVRRMVRAGTLRAERVLRPQGHTFVVLVPTGGQPAGSSRQQVSAEARTEQPQADAMVSLIQTTIATVLGPLVAELAASRQTVERQAERVAELERENGRQAAELERAASTVVALSQENDDLRDSHSPGAGREAASNSGTARESSLDRLRALAPWVLGLLAIVAVVLLLGWPE